MAMKTKRESREAEPIEDMNIVPLIDVLLVLLVMFIITIPVQSHAVKLDLPVNDPTVPQVVVDPVKNKVVITNDDKILWNGLPIPIQQLRLYLDRTQQMEPTPELHLQPESEARYETVDEVLAITKRAQITKMGFVGNEYYMNVF